MAETKDFTSTSTWNNSKEHLVTKWAENCKLYSGMHTQASRHYYFWGKIWGVPVIFFSAIASVGQWASLDQEQNTWVKITQASILLVLFIVSMLSHHFDYLSLSSKHNQCANSYEELERVIEEELAEDRFHRTSSVIFMAMVRKQLTSLKKTSPVVSNQIIDDYVNELKKLKSGVFVQREKGVHVKLNTLNVVWDRNTDTVAELSTQPTAEASSVPTTQSSSFGNDLTTCDDRNNCTIPVSKNTHESKKFQGLHNLHGLRDFHNLHDFHNPCNSHNSFNLRDSMINNGINNETTLQDTTILYIRDKLHDTLDK